MGNLKLPPKDPGQTTEEYVENVFGGAPGEDDDEVEVEAEPSEPPPEE